MISKKNIYSLEKTKNFFKEYPIILIYQHNNLTVKQHIDLKVQLQRLTYVKTLTVKNSIVDRVCFSFIPCKKEIEIDCSNFSILKKNQKLYSSIQFLHNKKNINNVHLDKTNGNQLKNILQGPLFLLGCHNLEEVKNIWGILKVSPYFLFMGSQFNNQIYTHLDIEKSLEINNNIYYQFLNIFDQQLNFQNSIGYNNHLLHNNVVYNKLFSLFEDQTFLMSYK
jgi:hypothetical protein